MRLKNLTVVDLGSGNLRSLVNALKRFSSISISVSNEVTEVEKADLIVLPGVGNFGDYMQSLRGLGFDTVLQRKVFSDGVKILGICVGMQALFESSLESPTVKGLGWLPGESKKLLATQTKKVPHMGWNEVAAKKESGLFTGFGQHHDFYFLHSYSVECPEHLVTGSCFNGSRIVAAIESNNIFGVQFHPEKSHENGQRLIGNFLFG